MLYYLYRFGEYLALRLPLETCYKIATTLADIYYSFAASDKKNIAANLEVVLGTKDKKVIEKHTKEIFRNFAKYLADFFRFSYITNDYILNKITLEGKENLDKALAKGKGAILVSAHLGNWELGGAVVGSLGYPIYAIVLDHKDKRVNDFFINQRAMTDVRVIQIGLQLKNCFKVLRKNKLLAIVGDRDFSKYGVKSEFFGKPTLLPKGPAFFSLKTGAPIIPTFVIRTKDDKFRLIFEKPIESVVSGTMEENVKNTIEKYIKVVEKYIRIVPDQWYVFRKVWCQDEGVRTNTVLQ